MKISIYFATHLFFVLDSHKRDIEHLKNEFKKYPWFEVDTIMIPVRGDFTQIAWAYPKSDAFLKSAHTLIVDTTYAPGADENLRGILREHDIFLITCEQKSNPQSYDVLNADVKILQEMVSLEYRTIMDIRDHIFNHVAFHDCALQIKK
ncbi:MAG: hypothetical protein KBB91_01380 [Candidatus Pacebacteria bacterium]|nr:hypothetical protein [Candidatus Paceibacterota bacterium]MBP9701134.1 hypothetical protein [Candidatus Paceibacterota bacterium]